MSSTKTLLGRKIRELRKQRGWTQEYLSEKLGINAKSVLRIESGQTFPTIQNLEKISNIFDIKIAELFNYDNLDDIVVIKDKIDNIIKGLDEAKIRYLFSFLNSIK